MWLPCYTSGVKYDSAEWGAFTHRLYSATHAVASQHRDSIRTPKSGERDGNECNPT